MKTKKLSIGLSAALLSLAMLASCGPKHEHTFGDPEWTWAANYTATATFACNTCEDYQEVKEATVTSSVTQAATCTADQMTTYVATVSFNESEYTDTKTVKTGDKLAHPFGDWTRKDDDTHERTCTCGEKETAPHTWNAGVVTTQPTHTTFGVKTYTCTVCAATKTEQVAKLADHTFGDWTNKDASSHERSCECGEKETAPHTWNEGVVTTEPTHTTFGVKTYNCTACGATKTEEVAKLTEHTYGNWVNVDENNHKGTCECGAEHTEAHTWNNGDVITAATFATTGSTKYTCTKCGAEKTVDTHGTYGGATLAELNAITLDTVSEWGNPYEDVDVYGIRRDASVQQKWKWFHENKGAGGFGENRAESLYNGLANSQAEVNDGNPDQLLANKVTVSDRYFVLRAGFAYGTTAHIRLSIISSTGTITTLPVRGGTGSYQLLANNWVKLNESQWVFGVKLNYDLNAYLNSDVILAIECEDIGNNNASFGLDQAGFYTYLGNFGGFNNTTWKALEVDNSTSWGNPTENADVYGLRKDAEAFAKWHWYHENNGDGGFGLNGTIFYGLANGQSRINDGIADQVVANKITVSKSLLFIRLGYAYEGAANVRVSIIDSDGIYSSLPIQAGKGYEALSNNWLKITAEQWVYGGSLYYDLSAYLDQVVTILIECEDTGATHSFGLNHVALLDPLPRLFAGFDATAMEALEVDDASEWGDPVEDVDTYGIRKNNPAGAKWSWYHTNNGQGGYGQNAAESLYNGLANSVSEQADGVADQVLVNKVTVSQNNFVLRVGSCYSNSVHVRLSVIDSEGRYKSLPVVSGSGYTALANNWVNLTVSQWEWGAKLNYDMSEFSGEDVVLVIEAEDDGAGNTSFGFDQAGFYSNI